jgi:hypothetical protein
MTSKSEDGQVNPCGHPGSDEQGKTAPVPPSGLTPERLAELRSWIATREYANPQTDLLIATRILEQGDL